MKPPQWLAEQIAAQGIRVIDGKSSRADADAALTAAVLAHPEFLADSGTALAMRLFGKWITGHSTSGDLFQSELFTGLPAVMRVAPGKSASVADMTAEDLDHARNMLWARTKNMVEGAEEARDRERAAFSRLYDKVRPLLADGKTVSDVLGKLAAQENAA